MRQKAERATDDNVDQSEPAEVTAAGVSWRTLAASAFVSTWLAVTASVVTVTLMAPKEPTLPPDLEARLTRAESLANSAYLMGMMRSAGPPAP